MALVCGLPYFRVKYSFPVTNATYTTPSPVAFLNKGRYLVVINTAIVGNLLAITQNFVVNAPVGTGDTIAASPFNNPAITDGGATNVVYRNYTSQIIANVDNTPIYFQIGITTIGGATYTTSTALTDQYLNYFHFIKIA